MASQSTTTGGSSDEPALDTKIAFIQPEGSKKRKKPAGDTEEDVHFKILPSPLTTYEEGSVVEFNYTNGSLPVRLAADPIQISYSVKKKTGDTIDYAPDTAKVFIDPAVGEAASFIHSVEIYCKGVCIYSERRGIFAGYQSAMIKSTDRDYWGSELPEAKDSIMNSSTSKDKLINKWTTCNTIIRCSALHGVPFLGRPKNFYAHRRKGGKIWQNKSPIIPPGVTITIRLTLASNLMARMNPNEIDLSDYTMHERPSVKLTGEDDDALKARQETFDKTGMDKALQVSISEIALLGERMRFKKYRLEENDTFSFHFDAPQMQHSAILTNSSVVQLKHTIPKNVSCGVVCFLYDVQFNADTKVRKTKNIS